MKERAASHEGAEPVTLHEEGDLQRLLVAGRPRRAGPGDQAGPGLVVGRLVGFGEDGLALVVYEDQPGTSALSAASTVDLVGEHIGDDVVLMFELSDPHRPLVIGRVRKRNSLPTGARSPHVEVEADGQRLTVIAEERLVLKCGKASITLTAAGKVLINGTYVSNRSSGVMQIRGGSVQIN
jgi:uncharacterized protein DUF6484